MVKRLRHLPCILLILAAVATVAAYQGIIEEKGRDKLAPGKYILWSDPGDVSKLDFRYGIGGSKKQPQPPFQFVDEDMSGTSPKVNVKDSRGASWNVKWGREARSSVFCTRLAWACGYFVEPEYFVPQGRIEGALKLGRAGSRISKDGSFRNARFQLRSGGPKYLEGYGWTLPNNPFLNTPELQGLKILVLLVSNWDMKDASDTVRTMDGRVVMDTNLSIFEGNGSRERRYFFMVDDWGGTLGKWGSNPFTWSRWDCGGFAGQTKDFLKVAENGKLRWGYNGKHRKGATDIRVNDIQWLLQYLGRISDDQIHTGLEASGAKPEDVQCYTQALRQRIDQLQAVANETPAVRLR